MTEENREPTVGGEQPAHSGTDTPVTPDAGQSAGTDAVPAPESAPEQPSAPAAPVVPVVPEQPVEFAQSASDEAWQSATTDTPPRPAEAQQQPMQAQPPVGWAAGQQQPGGGVLFGSAFGQQQTQQQHVPHEQPGYQPTPMRVGEQPLPRVPQQRRGMTGLVVLTAVLALIIGGGAGAVGGYLVADRADDSSSGENALDQTAPPADQTSAPSGSVQAVAEKVLPSVVQIEARGGGSAQGGTGFVISADGLIVTNNHVIEAAADGGQIRVVFHDGTDAPAEVVGRDPTSDVAVIKAQGKDGLPVVELGRSADLKVGQDVVAIGAPFELPDTVTSGIVSALHRPTVAGGDDNSQETVMDAIQTDAAINPGNSGGPLVNLAGQVIGINSAIYSPRSAGGGEGGSVGIGFAIPIDQARRTAEEITKTGTATQTVLGVSVRNDPNGGAVVADVTQGGPAAAAGIKNGDVITKLNDRRIDTSDALVAAVRSHAPGEKVKLELSDGSRTVEVTLAGQPVKVE
jgi:putative serine protease PepD